LEEQSKSEAKGSKRALEYRKGRGHCGPSAIRTKGQRETSLLHLH